MSSTPIPAIAHARDPLPKPICPPIIFGLPNEPILLASCPATVQYRSKQFIAVTQFRLCWLPTPKVLFDIPIVPEDHHPDFSSFKLAAI